MLYKMSAGHSDIFDFLSFLLFIITSLSLLLS